MSKCNMCGKYYTKSFGHLCHPEWEIWDLNDETREDAHKAYGVDAEDAATTWAEQEDSDGDYTIVGGSPVVVCVSQMGSTEIHTIIVSGESVPQYHGSEAKPEDVASVHAWNKNHSIGTTVKWTYKGYDDKMKQVVLSGEGKTSSKAYFDAAVGPEVRVDMYPYRVKLKDVQAIEVAKGAEESTSTT